MNENEWVTIDIKETGKLTPDHPDFDLDLYMKFLCRDLEKELNTSPEVVDFIKYYKKGK